MADDPKNPKEFAKGLSEDQAAEIIRGARIATGSNALGHWIENILFGDWRGEPPRDRNKRSSE